MNLLSITFFLNGALMMILPVALGIFLNRKFHTGWRLWWFGAVTFILSQVGHIPFNSLLTLMFKNGWLPSPGENWSLWFNAVVLGLSAGLWEESSRYITYRWWAKDARSWRQGLMLGAGHGGIEAVLLGGLVLVTYVNMLVLRSTNLEGLVPAGQIDLVQEQIQVYWSTPWHLSLLGAVERGFALALHLSASVIVLQAFVRRQIRWLWFAIAWHALVNALAVISGSLWGPLITEGILGVTALLSLAIVFGLRPATESGEEPLQPVMNPAQKDFEKPVVQETEEMLDRSRFQ